MATATPARPDVAPPSPTRPRVLLDGNEAAARVAYALSEVIALYPITPSSPMGEHADAWRTRGRPNLWGQVPSVEELQSEGGAAGALHGAVQRGALGTTFTASQGLLLMLPNMFKIAGELTPAVIHVAARTVATHALSIFGDHSDVMAARPTGWAQLVASSVQEAHDFALLSHAATLTTRVPFLHVFDGFRTSHELATVTPLGDDDLRALIDADAIAAHRRRGLSPEHPVLRGSAQNPDVFFQAREAPNPYYDAVPGTVQELMDQLGDRTGRSYRLIDYHGHPQADRVVVVMGSAAGALAEAVDARNTAGERTGVLTVRLFRPFPAAALLRALPPTVRAVSVLDRTKEPGAPAEPLLADVAVTLSERAADAGEVPPRVVGGRYGLASKEFTPAMAAAVLDDLGSEQPRRRFTVGIVDDVSHLSLPVDAGFRVDQPGFQAVIHGLGSDGSVGASKNSAMVLAERTGLHVQAYFEYDSRKAGATTTSHLRADPEPIRGSYLVEHGAADLVACHQFTFLERIDVLARARRGGTVLLNSPFGADEVWDTLPREVQQQILDKDLSLHVVDAYRIARELRLGGRINTVMQPCFFALVGLVDLDEAIDDIKRLIAKSYARAGEVIVERNQEAVDHGLAGLVEVAVPGRADSPHRMRPPVPADAPDLVQRVHARIIAGQGDTLPVSALPVDGTFPTGTTRYEKRQLAGEIPIWDPEICIDCGKCAIVCPHATIRMKVFDPAALAGAPEHFLAKDFKSRELPGHKLTIQVAPDDCTGCGICVDVCPAKSKESAGHKAINMRPVAEHRDTERQRWDFFTGIGALPADALPADSVKGSQTREPLFEFSSACSGCGETPYLKLLTQLFGDQVVVANATGCSSIYGGNLPTTPWATNADGRGPAWSNSLFEDNAEFGFGLQVAGEHLTAEARTLLSALAGAVGAHLAQAILDSPQDSEAEVAAQRERLATLRRHLDALGEHRDHGPAAQRLAAVAHALVRSAVWIVGGDGWAYDIGFGGLDHVLSTGRDVNVLVLDTEVYSNTGGQASKATPRAAAAKFAMSGKAAPKKDLGLIAMAYGHVYVAQVAIGANDQHTVKAFAEAAAWPGPSLILAYSTCIAHGIDMATSMSHQRKAVSSGHWPLFRYHPGETEEDTPLRLDSRKPKIPLRDFVLQEARFAALHRNQPEHAEHLLTLAQADVDERWRLYEQMAEIKRRRVSPDTAGDGVRTGEPADAPDGDGQSR